MTDYSELKRLAEAATPGPWECRQAEGAAAICHEHGWVADDFSEQTLIDTRYMATANPAAVLALIADCESAHKHWENDSRNVQVLTGELAGAQAMLETAYSERDQLKAENERLQKFEAAYMEWSDKTDWVQETIQGYELGMHRADVLHKRCRDGAFHQQAQADHIKTLMAEVKTLESQVKALQSDANSYQSGYDAGRAAAKAHADSWRAEAEKLRKDAARLDRLEIECEAYGTEIHEGNRWVVDGPFATVRDAIDAAMSKEAGQ